MGDDLSGRHFVVTGAGGGMGEALTRLLLEAGACVTAVDVKPPPEGLADGGLLFAQGDLTDAAFTAESIRAGAARFGRLDGVANVAGVLWFGRDRSCLDMDMDDWDRVFSINLKAAVGVVRAAVPLIREGGRGGSLVHVSTIQWMRGDPSPQDAYQTSKAALSALSRSLAMQLAGERIRSNCLLPGPVLSPLQARWNTEEIRSAVASYVPLGRIGAPEDVARAALFLLSDDASFITGVDLPVDGGVLLRN